jgi:outer membrane biosynthesis protein TonB
MAETGNLNADFLNIAKQDRFIQFKVSRNTLIAIICSLIVHAILIWWVAPVVDTKPLPKTTTIDVSLAPLPTPPVEPAPALPVEPEAKIEPPVKVITKKPTKQPKPSKPQDFKVPKVLSQPELSPQQVPITEPAKPEKPVQPEDNNEAPPVDMMAYVNRKRAQRDAAEAEAAKENAKAVALENGPSAEEKRQQRIMENLKVGTNGIFEIKRLEYKSASFSFKGWKGDYGTARVQFFEVEASSGQDIRLVLVRRMIAIIREHYQEDFDWESHRLGRTVVKSARLEDSAELEHFLMQEFFGTNYKQY